MPINKFSNRPLPVSVKKRAIAPDFSYPRTTLFPEKAFVISLPKAKKRLSGTLAEYKKANLPVEIQVFKAIDGMKLSKTEKITIPPGDYGCLLSHLKVIKTAKAEGYSCVLILEDDVSFVENFAEKLKKAMSELPSNWDMLWLGGLPREQNEPYSENLDRMFGSWGTYGYIIRDTMYIQLINTLSQSNIKYSVDDYFGRLHGKFNSFRTRVNYVIHTGKVSDRKVINTIKADE